jgi:hypothetical protein
VVFSSYRHGEVMANGHGRRARVHGATVMLRRLAGFNGAGRPRLTARTRGAFDKVVSRGVAQLNDMTGRQVKWKRMMCSARLHSGSTDDVVATVERR